MRVEGLGGGEKLRVSMLKVFLPKMKIVSLFVYES